jgi:hypothetical protein
MLAASAMLWEAVPFKLPLQNIQIFCPATPARCRHKLGGAAREAQRLARRGQHEPGRPPQHRPQ